MSLANMSLGTLGAAFLALFVTFLWLKIFAGLRPILAGVGVILISGSGVIGTVLSKAAVFMANFAGTAGQWLAGIRTGGVILTLVLIAVVLHDLHPRHPASKRTGWAAVALAALMVAGVTGFQALNSIPAHVRDGVSNAQQSFGR